MNQRLAATAIAKRFAFEPLEARRLLSAVVSPSTAVNANAATPLNPGHSPAEIRHAYGFDQIRFLSGKVAGDGAGQTIAIVNPFDDPNIAADLHQFDQQFGLPDPPALLKLDQRGGQGFPAVNARWASETALDVEWAHAIAPAATIALVEADSANLSDVIQAVDTARHLPGVSVVSMSWGTQEFESEQLLDVLFTTPAAHGGVTFVAAAGDVASGSSTQWPAISANVLSVGGTSLSIDSGSGTYVAESVWAGSAGGTSSFEPGTAQQVGARTVPDVSYNADPASGYAVYNTVPFEGRSGWQVVGGTSAGAPQWAALVAIADQGRQLNGSEPLDGSTGTLPMLYQIASIGFNSVGDSLTTDASSSGYTASTGLGSPRADQVAQALSDASAVPPPAPQLSDFSPVIASASGQKDGGDKGKPAVVPAGQPYIPVAPAFVPLRLGPSPSIQYLRSALGVGDVAPVGAASTVPAVSQQTARWSTTLISAAPTRTAGAHAISFAKEIAPPRWLGQVYDSVSEWVSSPLPASEDTSTSAMADLSSVAPPVIYHFATINIARTFSDTLGAFIKECASAPPVAATPPASHGRAWIVTFLALGADAVVLRFALARRIRKKKSAVLTSRITLHMPRRPLRVRTVRASAH